MQWISVLSGFREHSIKELHKISRVRTVVRALFLCTDTLHNILYSKYNSVGGAKWPK